MPRPAWIPIVAGALLLAAPAAARELRVMKLRFPPFTLPPGGNSEVCILVRVPGRTPFDLASYEIRHRGVRVDFAPQHFLVYHYRGERLAELGADAGRVVPSRACLDLGPVDRDRRQLVAGGTLPRSRRTFPPGVALRLEPAPDAPGGPAAGFGFVLDAEWLNSGSRTRRASTKVILRRVGRRESRRPAVALEARTAEQQLAVAPGEIRSTESSTGTPPGDVWMPAADACVVLLTGHMHKRGRFLGVDLLDASGRTQQPANGVPNPFEPGRRHLFGATDYTDPGTLDGFARPLLVRRGEGLRYACWHDNGVTTPVRLGCEEQPGTPPGVAAGLPGGGPAKPCTVAGAPSAECPATDPAYPARTFTGACVPAMLVTGPTPDDEACALVGASFDAVAGAPAGEECPVR